MIRVINVKRELEGRPTISDRCEHTSDEELAQAFANLGDFRDGGVFAGSFSGDSGWERHLAGDEIVQILNGSTQLHVITDDGTETLELQAGELVVVPKGRWHRFESRDGVTVLTATPQPTQHTYATDPRDAPTQTL